jgi:hypothetical protein
VAEYSARFPREDHTRPDYSGSYRGTCFLIGGPEVFTGSALVYIRGHLL